MNKRHARKDEQLTRFMQENGYFVDKRSFVSVPFVFTEESHSEGPHLFLFGVDKQTMHERIYNEANGCCQGCNPRHAIGLDGEWDHIKGGNSQHCDCLGNGRWVCQKFHRGRHVRPKFGESEAVKAFEKSGTSNKSAAEESNANYCKEERDGV